MVRVNCFLITVFVFYWLEKAFADFNGHEGPTEVKKRRNMETWFYIDDGGDLIARTRIWSNDKLQGFTGGVFIALFDADREPFWVTEQHTYGVNGKWIGESQRMQTWGEQIPPSMLPKIKSYAVVHRHTPTKRVWRWVIENKTTLLKSLKTFL